MKVRFLVSLGDFLVNSPSENWTVHKVVEWPFSVLPAAGDLVNVQDGYEPQFMVLSGTYFRWYDGDPVVEIHVVSDVTCSIISLANEHGWKISDQNGYETSLENKKRTEQAHKDMVAEMYHNLDLSVSRLVLDTRAQNTLDRINCRHVGVLVQQHERDLRYLKNVGDKTVRQIKKVLSDMGLSLGMTRDELFGWTSERVNGVI